jgi:hypothetical protein
MGTPYVRWAAVASSVLALMAACGDEPGAASGGQGAGAGGGAGPAQSQLCARYVECVAATTPGVLEQVSAQYGVKGSCWSDESLADACNHGCAEGLEAQALAFPDEARCATCVVEGDCLDPLAAHCAEGTCVACTANEHCTDPAAPTCGADGTCTSVTDERLVCLLEFIALQAAYCPEEPTCTAACRSLYEQAFGAGAPCGGADTCCGFDSGCGFTQACAQSEELNELSFCIREACCQS